MFLRSLGINVRLSQAPAGAPVQTPETSPPVVSVPDQPQQPPEPTIAVAAILERIERIEVTINQFQVEFDNRATHGQDIAQLRAELESLKSQVEGIDALRGELANMREAQLRVRIRQSDKNIIEDTVTIFDPEDSLNLQLPAR